MHVFDDAVCTSQSIAYVRPVIQQDQTGFRFMIHQASPAFSCFWQKTQESLAGQDLQDLTEAPGYEGLQALLRGALESTGEGSDFLKARLLELEGRSLLLTVFPGPDDLRGLLLEEGPEGRAGKESATATLPLEDLEDLEQIREQKDQLERFFSLNLDLLCIADEQGHFLKLNRAWEQTLGYSLQELQGMNFLTLVHPEDLADTVETMKQLDHQENVQGFVNRYRCRDGAYRWIEWRSHPYGDVYYAAARDVTERVRAQQKMADEQRRFQGLVESIDDVIFTLDREGRHTGVYGRWIQRMGVTADYFLGKTARQIQGTDAGAVHEEATRKALAGESVIYKWHLTDGENRSRYYQTSLSPMKDEAGLVTGVVGVGREITPLEEARQEARALQEEKTIILDAMEHRITYIDRDHRVIWANKAAAEYAGLDRSALRGKKCYQVYGPSARVEHCPSQKAMESGHQETEEIQMPNGSVWVIKSFPLMDEAGEITAVVETAIDVSHERALEKTLFAEKEKLRTTLHSIGDGVISVDHDLRIQQMNLMAEELTGWQAEEALGKPMDEVFHIIGADTRELRENPVGKAMGTGEILALENDTILVSRDGEERHIADSAAPIRDQSRQITGAVLVFRDVSQERAKKQEIINLSYYDYLTGVHNRRFFEEEVSQIDQARGQLPVTILMGDVNGLKLVNDVFGHLAGDRLLKKAAQIFRSVCGNAGVVCRWGGDEFVLCLPGTTEAQALDLCQKIMEESQVHTDEEIQLSVSLGFATKTEQEQDLLEILKRAEDNMYRKKLMESRSLRFSVINSLKKTMFEKSNETEEHGERLKRWCRSVGEHLQLSEMEIYELELLALLHDIGKVAIPDAILKKPGPLNDREWEEMRRHPEIGYRIAQSTPELAQISEKILSHHERFDGTGYPRGLEGGNIPVLSRILAVIDAYDAMTTDRPYRRALSRAEALAELHKCAGTQFDPAIVSIFVDQVLQEA